MASHEIAKAWARTGITTRWEAELLSDLWRQKKREYNRTYRRRHPEREAAMQPLYYARHQARQKGLVPPPIQDWNKISGGFEVTFARGFSRGAAPQRAFRGGHPKLSSLSAD